MLGLMFLLITSSAFAKQRLNCLSTNKQYSLTGMIKGWRLYDYLLEYNTEVIAKGSYLENRKSMDMYRSENFRTSFPYPTYNFYIDSKVKVVKFPAIDMRNINFIGLIDDDVSGELELFCSVEQ